MDLVSALPGNASGNLHIRNNKRTVFCVVCDATVAMQRSGKNSPTTVAWL
jgi:hypothetical protein